MKINKKKFMIILWKQKLIKFKKLLDEFDGDYDDDELRLMRIKFTSEIAN